MVSLPDIAEIQALASILTPGLVFVGIRSAVSGGPKPELKDSLVLYAAMSAAYYAVAIPLFNWPNGLVLDHAVWTLLLYVIVPSVLGVAAAYEYQNQWVSKAASRVQLFLSHPVPAAWDFAFSELREGRFILVTLTDGSRIAGFFGSLSFASSSSQERDIYIESTWEFEQDEKWIEVTPKRGMLLCGRDIRSIEMFGGKGV